MIWFLQLHKSFLNKTKKFDDDIAKLLTGSGSNSSELKNLARIDRFFMNSN